MKTRTRSLRIVAGAFLAACGFIVGPARGGVLDSLHLKPQANATITQTTIPGNAITPLVARGTGWLDFLRTKSGVCPDQVGQSCNNGQDSCECDVYVGSVTLPKLGKTTMTLTITSDDTAASSTGSGDCVPGSGHGTFCNSKNECLAVFVTGNLCTALVSDVPSPVSVISTLDLNEVFWIDPSSSTGPVANASGGGNLSVPVTEHQLISATIETGYTVINGVIQTKPTTTTIK